MRDPERAGEEDRPRADAVERAAPQRRREDARARDHDRVCGDPREPHVQVREHVHRVERRREADRAVPCRLELEQAARVLARERRERVRKLERLAFHAERLVHLRHEPHGDGAGGARRRGQRGERRSARASAAVEQHARCERGDAPSERTDGRAFSEVAAAQPRGNEIAHPRDPRVVADHAADTGDRRDREEYRALRLGVERQERQRDEQDVRLPRDGDSGERRAARAERCRRPRGGQLNEVREERQRAQKADEHRAAAERERPRHEHRTARAGRDDLRKHAFRDGRAERFPQAAARSRDAIRGGVRRGRGAERGGSGHAGPRKRHRRRRAKGLPRFQRGVIENDSLPGG